jgi:osmotically-inducible protein OsmY
MPEDERKKPSGEITMGRTAQHHVAMAIAGWPAIACVNVAAEPRHPVKIDHRIDNTVRKSCVLKTYFEDDYIIVEFNEGVVTPVGTANGQAEIDLTTERVGDIGGVESVENQMTIATPHFSIE